MSSLLPLINRRQSCRSFKEEAPVPHDLLESCVAAAHLAPSACNAQPWKFIVVDDPQRVQQAAQAVGQGGMNKFAATAPAFIVVVEHGQNLTAKVGGRLKNQQYAGIDIGIATGFLSLRATELGLDTCILGWFDERRLRMILSIPKALRIRLVLAVGYKKDADPIRPKVRKPLADILGINKF